MKKYSALKAEFEIQEKDKELLLKELLMKKKENAAMRTQVEQYEKLLNEVSKEMEADSKQDLELSHSSKKETPPLKVKTLRSEAGDSKRVENTVAHLNKVIAKERAKIRSLKNLYMK